MAKSREKTGKTAAGRPSKVPADSAEHYVAEHDIASRAYGLYLARNREHGHDVDDWLEAERELQKAARPPGD